MKKAIKIIISIFIVLVTLGIYFYCTSSQGNETLPQHEMKMSFHYDDQGNLEVYSFYIDNNDSREILHGIKYNEENREIYSKRKWELYNHGILKDGRIQTFHATPRGISRKAIDIQKGQVEND